MYASVATVGVSTPEMGQATCAIAPKVTKATHISQTDVMMLMSARTAHALQEVFATTRKEGIGVLVEREENFPNKAIHAALISG